jgi:MATE family multidrug resistance protein
MCRKFLTIAIPTMIMLSFSYLMEITNMYFVGHLDDPTKVVGIGLGNMMTNILITSNIMGINGGIGTLVPQAFGANNLRKCGIYLNRGRALSLIIMIPMTIIMLFTEKILLAIG